MTDERKKKRGRPPLTSEQKAMRPKKISKPGISSTKEGGYMSQKRYREMHRGAYYEPKLRIPIECKSTFEKLLLDTGLNISQICLLALEEKYGVILQKPFDKP